MRISTAQFFRTGLNSINAQQADLLHIYQQMGSGKRMVTPSDDPLAAAQSINLRQSEALNKRFGENRSVLKQNLGMQTETLGSATRLLQDVKTQLVYAGNGTLSDADRRSLAEMLKGARDNMLALANATDGNGQYMFSGNLGDQPGFDTDGNWNRNISRSTQRLIQVDETRQLASSDLGSDVFARVTPGSQAYFTRADAGNTGTGQVAQPRITDLSGADVGKNFVVTFHEDSASGELRYHVDDGQVPPVPAYDPADPSTYAVYADPAGGARDITLGNGVIAKFDGVPRAGDSFHVDFGNAALAYRPVDNTVASGTATLSNVTITDPTGQDVDKDFNVIVREVAGNPGSFEYVVSIDGIAQSPVAYVPPTAPATVSIVLGDGVSAELAGQPDPAAAAPNDQAEFNVAFDADSRVDFNIFRSFDDILAALDANTGNSSDPVEAARIRNAINTALQRFDEHYDNILTVQSSVGTRLTEIDAIDATGVSRNLGYANRLQQLEDIDYYEASTRLQLRTSALEAAALAFRKIQATNLLAMKGG